MSKREKGYKEYKLSGPGSPLSPHSIVSGIEDKPVCSETYGSFQDSILQWIDDQKSPEGFPYDYYGNSYNLHKALFTCLKPARAPKQANELRKERTDAVKARRVLFNKNRDQLMLAMLHAGRAYICAHTSCGEMRNLHVDHMIPLSKGGSDDLSNLQFLCHKHNCEKGSKYPN